MRSSAASRCPLCRELVSIGAASRDVMVQLVVSQGQGLQRAVFADGQEVHRCPFTGELDQVEVGDRAHATGYKSHPGAGAHVGDP